jgi:myosin heavy subunit
LILCQSVVRRKRAITLKNMLRHERQVACATRIQAVWRGFIASDNFIRDVSDIIFVQSLIRRKLATTKTDSLRQERREHCATLIQAAWRGCIASDDFIQTVSDIILVQSLARRLIALRVLRLLKEEEHLLQVASSTKISSTWRRFFAVREYKYSIAGKRIEANRILFMLDF